MLGFNCNIYHYSFLMCGLPSLATFLLLDITVEHHWWLWFLDIVLKAHLQALPYVYPTGLAAQTASVYLTVVVTIER